MLGSLPNLFRTVGGFRGVRWGRPGCFDRKDKRMGYFWRDPYKATKPRRLPPGMSPEAAWAAMDKYLQKLERAYEKHRRSRPSA